MLEKTRGIVLQNIPYNDIHSITLIYTEEFGAISYLTTLSKGKKSRVPKPFFQPLSVLELDVDHQNRREIQRIKDARVYYPACSLLSNPLKVSISFFLAEFLSRVLKEIAPDRALFHFILQSIKILDLNGKSCANFHLAFMVGVMRFLGFFPNMESFAYPRMFFDMKNGEFTLYKPFYYSLNPDESLVVRMILRMNYENMHVYRFSRHERKWVVERMLEYYRIHLADFPEIKSLDILHDVFG